MKKRPKLIYLLSLVLKLFVCQISVSIYCSAEEGDHVLIASDRIDLEFDQLDSLYLLNRPNNLILMRQYSLWGFTKAVKQKRNKQIVLWANRMGVVGRTMGDYDEALFYHLKALDACNQTRIKIDNRESYNYLGELYHFMGQYQEAIHYYNESIDLVEEGEADRELVKSLRGIANSNRMLGNYDRSLSAFREISDIKEKQSPKLITPQVHVDMAKLYQAMANYGKAEKLYREALEYALNSNNLYGLSGIHTEMGLFYLEIRNYNSAILFADKGLHYSKKLENKEHQKEAYHILYKAYTEKQDYKKANHYLLSYSVLKDRILNEKKAMQINKLEIEFEAKQNEKIIQTLLLDKELQQMRINRKNDQFWTLLVILLFILVTGYLVIKHRQLRDRKKAAELQLKLLRSQINPHFLFNALNTVYGLSRVDSKKSSEAVLKLSEILRYVIYECDKDWVLIKDELRFVKEVIEFASLREGKYVDVQYLIECDSDQGKIPPMLLIPLIENCFKHTNERPGKQAWIKINIDIDQGHLSAVFENSNFEPTFSRDRYMIGGLGLKNVKSRLDLAPYKGGSISITEKSDPFKVHLTFNNLLYENKMPYS